MEGDIKSFGLELGMTRAFPISTYPLVPTGVSLFLKREFQSTNSSRSSDWRPKRRLWRRGSPLHYRAANGRHRSPPPAGDHQLSGWRVSHAHRAVVQGRRAGGVRHAPKSAAGRGAVLPEGHTRAGALGRRGLLV